ncbi:MAG: phenylalanine--tRNA ligase subunit beta, partial [Oscillospiraceae bacterium]
EIPLDVDWINRFLGIEVSRDAMIATLLSLEFKMNGDKVVVPSFRADVKHKADLAEEVARYYGYNNIPSTSIQGACYGSVTAKQKLERLAIGTLLSEGMNEVCTYTFISPKAFDKVRIPADSPLRRTVTILNPLGEDTSVMRTCVYPSMMEVLARNYNNRNASASLFELGREYIPAETPDQLPEEKQVLALGMYGEQFDYYSIKGAVDALLDAFGIRDIDVEAVTDHPTFHPGRCAAVSKNGTPIALLGEVHPAVCQNYALGARAYLARIDFSVLGALTDAGRRAYRPLPRFPASTRDMALLCSDTLPVLTIEKAVRSAVGEILESVELFDHYKGAQIPQGKKSLAFALVMRAADRTLTDAEVGAAMERALSSVTALGAELRA